MLFNKVCTFFQKYSFEHSMRNLFNLIFERFMGPLPYTTLIYGSLVYLPIWSYAILYLIFNQKMSNRLF